VSALSNARRLPIAAILLLSLFGAYARGAINGIMAEVVEDHIHMHMVDEDRAPSRHETKAADELIEVLKSYIR
jgi:hypothetical protein